MDTRRELGSAARRFFGLQHVRPEQLDAMEAALSGRDVLAVMPTGSGKSAIYPVAPGSNAPGAPCGLTPAGRGRPWRPASIPRPASGRPGSRTPRPA
ncbi:DEAD/DEAH box helicase [Mycolicibacterium cosmeticum]|uniref:DEAD/DEAH box helicase n=1 Tax=Mycolicibacterium cosmeticum TaxID=258533 RepID=UPI0038994072